MHIVNPEEGDHDEDDDEIRDYERRHPGFLEAIAQAEEEISAMIPKERDELYQRALQDIKLGR